MEENSSRITVIVNGKPVELVAGASVALLVAEMGLSPDGTAVAINNEVVPKSSWTSVILSNKTEITLIRAVSGG